MFNKKKKNLIVGTASVLAISITLVLLINLFVNNYNQQGFIYDILQPPQNLEGDRKFQYEDNYILDNNSVYIDDTKVYINITPHTSNNPTINFISKQYSGEIDLVVGFNTSKAKPTKAQYNPKIENVTKSYVCYHEFNYTLNPKYATCYADEFHYWNNETERVIYWEGGFESGNIETKTVYWTEEEMVWTDVSDAFTKVNRNFRDYDTWYYVSGFSVNAGQSYSLKLTLQPQSINEPSYKYYFGVKPSGETLQEAIENDHFYYIDPWTEGLNDGLVSYWKLDEASGVVIDSVGENNGTNNGSTANVAGLINTAYSFATDDSITVGSGKINFSAAPFTINGWIYADSLTYYDGFYGGGAGGGVGCFAIYFDNEGDLVFGKRGTNEERSTGGARFTTGSWQMVTVVYNTSGLHFIKNGGSPEVIAYSSTFSCPENYVIGAGSGDFFNGDIDEVGVWNRSLTGEELIALYNSGSGISYTTSFGDVISPVVTLNSPANNSNFTSGTIDLKCTATDDIKVSNVTVYIDGSANETNSSGLNNTEYIFTKTLSDGTHNWTCQASDNSSNIHKPSERYISIDSTLPIISITEPNETISYQVADENLTLTYSISDTHIDTCWSNWTGTNTTINCLATSLNLSTPTDSNRSIRICANDTYGNENCSSRSWSYTLFENNQTYESIVVEGSNTLFKLNINFNDSLYTNAVVLLYYNGTGYATTETGASGTYEYNKNKTIPPVDSQTDIEFYWNINLNNGTDNFFNSTAKNQTITILGIDNCSFYNETLYGFEIVDEKTKTRLNATNLNTSLTINAYVYDSTRTTLIQNFAQVFYQVNPVSICIYSNLSNGETYSADVQLQYDAGGYAQEFYHIQNATITNASLPTNITLYDLDDASTQAFVITYKDSNFLPVSDALIQIKRKYIGEGIFRTVEIPKTDDLGETTGHLEVDEVIYSFVITKNGGTIATFDNKIAVCQNPTLQTCEINLNSFASNPTLKDYTQLEDFTFDLSWDESTSTITVDYTVPSGTSTTVSLNSTLFDGFGNTTVCSDTLTSASGTLTCIVPASFGNSSVVSTIYKQNSPIGRAMIQINPEPSDLYGNNIIFLGLFLYLTLIGIGISDNTMITGFFLIIGGLLAVALNIVDATSYIGAGATILWLFLAIIIVLIKGARRQ